MAPAVQKLQSDGIQVREANVTGDKVVILVTDIHNQEYQADLFKAVSAVRERLGVTHFVVEGWPIGPVSETHKISDDIRNQLQTVYNSNPTRRLPLEEMLQLGFTTRRPPPTSTPATEQVIDLPGITFIGCEGRTMPGLDRSLLISVIDKLLELNTRLETEPVIVCGIEDRLTEYFHTLENAQLYLTKRYPDFVGFDLTGLHRMRRQGDTQKFPALFPEFSKKPLADALASVQAFEEAHCVGPRSKQAVEVAVEEMRMRGLDQIGIVFGLAHSLTLSADHPSIQSLVKDRGIGHIVVDAVYVKISESPDGAYVINLPTEPR